jgi:NAD+ kinase
MQTKQTSFHRIIVLAYPATPGGQEQAATIARFLEQSRGAPSVAWGSLLDPELLGRIENEEFDLVIALGGDGTVLRAGHLCAPQGIPILGINLGRFGFLTEIQRGKWREGLTRLVDGRYRIEERMLLKAEHRREGKLLGTWPVINEVVICRGQFVRPIRVKACVDGHVLTTYVADGVIAATATGSTAYALAVGGPIMPPELHNILLIPVAPHISMDRAIILSQGARVKMLAYTDHEAVMSVDGHTPLPLLDGDEVTVEANELTVKFIRFREPGYFYGNISAYMEHNPSAGNIG